ncbi:MAG: signal transduction histidine kinase [Ramlibacter sp.]|nr:signal transduction histidine kinase [Ramlibacter sp.]
MSTPSTPDDTARVDAQRELTQLREQISQAQEQLARLQAEIAQTQGRFGASGTLLAVNQQLVLAALRAQIDAEDGARSVQEATLSARQRALADHQSRYAQLSEANEHLVLAAIGAQELQAAAEQAQQRQTELLALVAHELRHPLAPIRNAAAILGRIPEQPLVLGRIQAIIERQVKHMARLVSDLLDSTRVATGKLRIERQRIDLVGILAEVLEACRPAMDARVQEFTGPELPASLAMDGDPGRLAQVFSNLLDNASKYTPHGGQIRLSVDLVDAWVVIAVSDSGIGITAEALPRVFEPFVQDLHATVFNGVGLGLGLTVVRELVEAHGGTVSASSPGAGLGSRFVVTLPMAGSGGE